MDWNRWGDDSIAALMGTLYYGSIVLWIIIGFSGVGIIAWATIYSVRKFSERRKINKTFKAMTKELENLHGH